MRKKKKDTLTTAKDKAWKAFSKYIRLHYADENGYVKCVTCGFTDHWTRQQAGHFIDGRSNTVLFDERLVYPQCGFCNISLRGNKEKYTEFMLKQGWSVEQLLELDNLKRKTKKLTIIDFMDIKFKYEEKLNG